MAPLHAARARVRRGESTLRVNRRPCGRAMAPTYARTKDGCLATSKCGSQQGLHGNCMCAVNLRTFPPVSHTHTVITVPVLAPRTPRRRRGRRCIYYSDITRNTMQGLCLGMDHERWQHNAMSQDELHSTLPILRLRRPVTQRWSKDLKEMRPLSDLCLILTPASHPLLGRQLKDFARGARDEGVVDLVRVRVLGC